MYDRAWQVPQDQFVAAGNASESLDDAAAKIKELAGGQVPRWALLARANSLRKEGVGIKELGRDKVLGPPAVRQPCPRP